MPILPPLVVKPLHPVEEGKVFTAGLLAVAALWWGAPLLVSRPGAAGRRPAGGALLPLLAIHAALALSLLGAGDLPTALARWGALALWSALVPLTVLAAVRDARWLPRLTGAAVFGVGSVAALTVAGSVGLGGLAHLEAGPFGNRNQLGQFLALGVWPLLVWALARRRWPARALAVALLGLVAEALLITRSKGAWLSLPAAGIGAWLLLTARRGPMRRARPRARLPLGDQRRWALTLGVIGVVLGAALVADFVRRRPEAARGELETVSWQAGGVALRVAMWRGTLALFAEHPLLGVGAGQWPLAFPPHLSATNLTHEFTRPREAHSDWLQFLAETGVVGLLALALLVACAWRWAADGVARRPSGGRRAAGDEQVTPGGLLPPLALLTLGALAAVDFPLQRAVPATLGAVWLGTLAARRLSAVAPRGAAEQRATRDSPRAAGRWQRIAVVLVWAAGAAALGPLLTHAVAARHLGVVRAALEERMSVEPSQLAHSAEVAWRLGASPLEADRLAAAALRVKAPALAVAILSEACRRDPLWFDHWRLASEAFAQADEPRRARLCAAQALVLAPPAAPLVHGVALTAWAAGASREAEAAFRRARDLAPDDPALMRDLGLFLTDQGRLDTALEHLRAAVASAPGDAHAWQGLGAALQRRGDRRGAAAALDRALALDPALAEAWHLRGRLHLEANALAEAERALRQAVALAPDSPGALEALAMTCALQWRTDEALDLLARALAADPSFAPAWRTRGLVLTQLGRTEEARAALREAARLAPGDPLTRLALERLPAARDVR